MDSGNENQCISLSLCFPFFKNTLLLQTCEERVDDFRKIKFIRSCGRVVRQSSAKARTAVRTRSGPLFKGIVWLRSFFYLTSTTTLESPPSIVTGIPPPFTEPFHSLSLLLPLKFSSGFIFTEWPLASISNPAAPGNRR